MSEQPVQHGQPVTIEPAQEDETGVPQPPQPGAGPTGAEPAGDEAQPAFSVEQDGDGKIGQPVQEQQAQELRSAPPNQVRSAEPAEGARNTGFVPGEQAPTGESGEPLPAPGLQSSERQPVTATSNESPAQADDAEHALARAHAGLGILAQMANRLLSDIEGYVPQSVISDARSDAAQVMRDVL